MTQNIVYLKNQLWHSSFLIKDTSGFLVRNNELAFMVERWGKVNILQISDTHFFRDCHLPTDCFRESFKGLRSIKEKFLALKKEMLQNNVTVHVICHCGDICHSGELEDYQVFRDIYQEVFGDIPLVVCPGNHDVRAYVEEVFQWNDGQILDLGDLQILSFYNCNGVNTCGEISVETCQMLDELLESQLKKETILLAHHHVFSEQSAMAPAKINPRFQEILKKQNILALFNGHTHSTYEKTWNLVPVYTVGSMCFRAVEIESGILQMTETAAYHLFSYENSKLSLEITGALDFKKDLGLVNFP